MKKLVVIFSLVIFILFLGFNLVWCSPDNEVVGEAEKAKEAGEKELLLTPTEKNGTAKTVIDRTLEPQGLEFTPGGVRPIEPGAASYPNVGDEVIFIAPESQKTK